MELYKRYRPDALSKVVGQKEAVKILGKKIKGDSLPHTILLSGPSGCGKTTIARILATRLGCSKVDLSEINCADFRGIEMVRDIRSRMALSPSCGQCRVWIIDEAHQLSSQAQNAFLKILEDTPRHVYFFLATTEPEKLIATVRNRAMPVKLSSIRSADMGKLIADVLAQEGASLEDEVADKLVACADGSARRALVLLEQVLALPDSDEQLNCLESSVVGNEAIQIARALLNPRTRWPEMAALLKQIEEEPEQLRWMVLGYTTNVMLSKATPRAYAVIAAFRDNFYDSKRAGLVAACYEVVVAGAN